MGGTYTARLAGMLPPYDPFELAELRERTLDEIGAPAIESGLSSARRLLVDCLDTALADDHELLGLVDIAADIWRESDGPNDLLPFYLLSNARHELATSDEQWYWDGATRENIIDIMRAEATRFIEEERRARSDATQ